MEFEDQQFDCIGVSFLLHELPPKYAEAAVNEIARCLAHEGVVSVCESPEAQVEQSWWSVIRRHGFKGLYFETLARTVHESFLQAWLKWDPEHAFLARGFELLKFEEPFLIKFYDFRKI